MKLVILTLLLFTTALFAQEYKYIGSQKCKSCHVQKEKGSQYVGWLQSRHSHAYWRLKSEWSLFLAHLREKYQDVTDPSTDERCLKCHTTIQDNPKEMISETYNMEEGIGCETCHGPASGYIKTHMQKDKTTLDDGGINPTEEVCVKCHHDGSFVFADMFPKIQHSFPKEVQHQ